MSTICTSYDSYLHEIDTTVLVITLSDGTKVYSDDGRYGEFDKAWLRLATHLKETALQIESISIKFRSHVEVAATRNPNTVGFFYTQGAACWIGQPTAKYFIVGTVEKSGDSNVIKSSKWRVPEVIKEEDETREIVNYSEQIIWDNNATF